jgi:hypothetical protein
MKSRSPKPQQLATKLEKLEFRLDEARTAAARMAESKAATERKLDVIGQNLADLKRQLAIVAAAKARTKK